jgi:molecular chaperone DnaJ
MPSGARLRVVGAGDHSRSDLPPGDLYVTVLVLPHDRFEVVGENLVCEVHIDAFEAMLGALLTVQGLDGQAISVRIPPGTNHGSGIRLTGQGLPNVNQASSRGDLIVRVLVRVPALNDEQAALVRQAQALGRPAA